MPDPKVTVTIIVVAVLGLGLIGGGLYFFVFQESDSSDDANLKLRDVGSCAKEGRVCERQGQNMLYLTVCKGSYPDCECDFINCGTKGCTNGQGCKTDEGGWIDDYDDYINYSDDTNETVCIDSDGGKLFSTKGACSADIFIGDSCANTFFLHEAYCDITDSCKKEVHDCTEESKVCSDGACKVASSCSYYSLYLRYKEYTDFYDALVGQPIGTTVSAEKAKCKSLDPIANWYTKSTKFGCSAGIGEPAIDCNDPAILQAKSVCNALTGQWTCNEAMRLYTCSCGEEEEPVEEEEELVCGGAITQVGGCVAQPCDTPGEFCTPNTETLECECMDVVDSCRNFCTANGLSAGHPIPCDEWEVELEGPPACCCLDV